jgi:colanic acid/amylovoran biosynthesis glycosyltransferase
MRALQKAGGKIKVLHNTPVWLPQTHTWMYNQVKYSHSDRIDNHIVCEQTENLDQFHIDNIHCLPEAPKALNYLYNSIKTLRLRRYRRHVVSISNKMRAQIMHSHFGDVGWANIAAAEKANLKHVTTFYGYDVNLLPQQDARWRTRYQKLFENVEVVLCEGPHMASCIVNMGCPEKKIKVQHLGIEMQKIPFQPRSWRPGEILRVLITASFREKKGIPDAIKALGRLQENIPLEITIIGDAGPARHFQLEKKRINEEIEQQKLQSKVRLLGYQPHNVLLREAYKHHIFLSPSVTASDGDTEGGVPVTIIEMAASGMIVVSTNHCDIPAVIHHNDTGLLAEEHDVNGLVKNLNWLVDNPDRWIDFQLSAREHIKREYDARIQGKKLADIYSEIIDVSSD